MPMKKPKASEIIAVIFIIAFLATFYRHEVIPTLENHDATSETDYYAYAESLDLAEIINSPALTMEVLENRNGKLIIERIVGEVTDAETGEGYIIGWPEFYIDYAEVQGISNGDIICSYLIYNPDNNDCNDIMLRFDYIIDNK